MEGGGDLCNSEGHHGRLQGDRRSRCRDVGAYAKMKFVFGVHRVQRVPDTKRRDASIQERRTVAVLPEAEEVDVEIKPDDLRIETNARARAQAASTSTRRNWRSASPTSRLASSST